MSRAQAFKAASTDHDVTRARAAAPVSDTESPAAPAAVPHQLAHVPVTSAPVQLKKNGGGLPEQLKSGIESLSGVDMSDVKVHYGSPQPAQLQAHAYAQGQNIHLAPGQEQHLPHEAWHVVQQKQGRVQPTMQMKGVSVNDSNALESEADRMGQRALREGTVQCVKKHHNPAKKKWLPKGLGAQQNQTSQQQLALIQQGGISRKDAKRKAQGKTV